MNDNSKVRQTDPRKKILFVVTKSVWGGAGKYVCDLATNLPKTNFEVCVAAGGNGPLAQKIKEANIAYYDIKNFQRDINVLKEFLAGIEILRLLFKIRPDIIHVNSSKAGGIVGVAGVFYKILTSNFELLTVFTAHGWAFHEERPKWQIFFIKLFSRLTALLYDKIICVSEFDRQSAIKNKIARPEKLITIHNGIEIKKYEFLPKKTAKNQIIQTIQNSRPYNLYSNGNDAAVIGTIGEFTHNKGQKYLIDAAQKLKIANLKFKIILIGWGEEKKNLELRIKNLELENNVFLIDNLSFAAPYLKAFDIFVLPSLKEGLPYTLLEAGLAELPAITTPVGGIPEIIKNKKTGLLVKPGDSEALKNAIKELIANRDSAKSLAANLRQKILDEFNFEKMLNSTLSAYEK